VYLKKEEIDFFFWGGGSATPCASPPPRLSIFSDNSFSVHHPVSRDDRHLLARAMASDFSEIAFVLKLFPGRPVRPFFRRGHCISLSRLEDGHRRNVPSGNPIGKRGEQSKLCHSRHMRNQYTYICIYIYMHIKIYAYTYICI
jgi:hypothetical protein